MLVLGRLRSVEGWLVGRGAVGRSGPACVRYFGRSAALCRRRESQYSYSAQNKPRYLGLVEYPKPKYNFDGLPKEETDQTPVDGRKPKRGAVWASLLEKTLRENGTWEAFKAPLIRNNGVVILPRLPPVIPEPRNGMTVELFLKKIGRGMDKHIEAIKTWENLFSKKTKAFKEMGLSTPERKYLLRMVEKYRQGIEPRFEPLKSKAHKHKTLEWRLQLITQPELRKKYHLD